MLLLPRTVVLCVVHVGPPLAALALCASGDARREGPAPAGPRRRCVSCHAVMWCVRQRGPRPRVLRPCSSSGAQAAACPTAAQVTHAYLLLSVSQGVSTLQADYLTTVHTAREIELSYAPGRLRSKVAKATHTLLRSNSKFGRGQSQVYAMDAVERSRSGVARRLSNSPMVICAVSVGLG